MKNFECLTVISVEYYCIRLPLPALNVSKWLTGENVTNLEKQSNVISYFNKVTDKLHYLLHFKYDNLSFVTYYISRVTFPTLPISEEMFSFTLCKCVLYKQCQTRGHW